MRPLAAPQASPHPFAVPATSKAVWMPPAIIEDPDAPAVEEGEGLSVSGIIRSLIPGISLYDAYQSWKAGDYRGMFLNGGVGALDLLSFGSISKARGLWAFAGGVVKSRVKAEVVDAAAGEAGNVVGDRLGAEAGLLTEMLVSGVLSGKLNSQDQKVLGFVNDGRGPVTSRHYSTSASGRHLHQAAQAYRRANNLDRYRNVATADVSVNGVRKVVHFKNIPGSTHSEQRLLTWYDLMKNRGKNVIVHGVYSERPPCGPMSAYCRNTLGYHFGQYLDVWHGDL